MSSNRLRWIWPGLCVVLAASLAISNAHWRKQLRVLNEKKKKPALQPAVDKRAAAFFRELALLRGYQATPPLTDTDAARLAAYDRVDLNKQWAMGREKGPTTFAHRDQVFTQSVAVPLAPVMRLQLGAPCKYYRYELTNKSDHTQPAPILFQDDRWDSAAELVTKAGFKSIPDEVERAVAIWRYVCPRRVFGDPPTEGPEEHDVIKFLSLYGYGFCDDSARAVATLAELSGLKSRIWELDGHVVAEVMANGRWRMLDADQQAYFHRAGAPQDILGVEELAADRKAFTHLVSFRNASEYLGKYTECFLSQENNKVTDGGTASHNIAPVLRAGERIAFTNYNWGRYFLGKYPTPPPQFYNGTFTYALHAQDFSPAAGEFTAEPIEKGLRLRNTTDHAVSVELPFSYPFPIVGGAISGTPTLAHGTAQLYLADAEHGRSRVVDLQDPIDISLNYFVAILTTNPTHRFSIIFSLGPKAVLELRDFKVLSDFQFAGLALLPLAEGANEFHAHFPEHSNPNDFDFAATWR